MVERIGRIDAPWEAEEDNKVFTASGLPCLILRNPDFGSLNGYVALPVGHPAHGADLMWNGPQGTPPVHGGWTFNSDTGPQGIEAAENCWFVGFDTSHSRDLQPYIHVPGSPMLAFIKKMEMTLVYRDMAYVEQELRDAAEGFSKMVALISKE